MTAPTITYALTVNLGCPTVKFRATVSRAADRFCPTIPYTYLLHGHGGDAPTISFKLTIDPIGCPTIRYTATLADMSFVFSGAPPVCSVSPPFVIHGKPLPPIKPSRVNAPLFPAIPDFNFGPIYNELGDLNAAVRRLSDMVQQMGAALAALRARQQSEESSQGQSKQKTLKLGNFVEVKSARATSKHKITNPDDKEQFVNITQIDGLLFKNGNGQTIVWHR